MKVVVCACEDVSLADIEHCFLLGYRHLEEVKRYTGFGTGPCQGKSCVVAVARLCQAAGAEPVPFTSRPPLVPTPLGLFAGKAAGKKKLP